MRASAAVSILLLLALGASPSAVHALKYGLYDQICISDAIPARIFEKRAPIPIGCELVDCCPGCPGPGPLELRVNIDATIMTGAELRFENLPGDALKRMKIGGAARLEGDRILLRAGDARISGVPYARDAAAPVALLKPVMRSDAARRVAAPSGARGASAITDHIIVQQFRGPHLVNSFSWGFVIRPCRKPPTPPMPQFDTLRINGLAAGEDAVVMMDALEATGCRDGGGGSLTENVFVSTGTTTHPNLMAPAGCNTELAIFTKNNAMKWETAVPWTNNLGDVHTVTLDPVIRPEVHIWVMDDATAARAQTHIDKAIEIYRDNRVGVLFQPIIKKLSEVATDPVAAAETVRSGIDPIWWDCLDGPDTGLSAIKAQPFYKANKLNVYYDDRAIGGKNCAIKRTPGLCTYSTTQFPPGDANITFLGTAATLTTLAHELGHAYGLRPAKCKGHTEGVTGFGSDNLMCTGSSCTNRSKLTLGQVFRMNTYANEGWGGTMLIPNDIPTRVPRLCKPDFAHSATCPTLSLPFPP